MMQKSLRQKDEKRGLKFYSESNDLRFVVNMQTSVYEVLLLKGKVRLEGILNNKQMIVGKIKIIGIWKPKFYCDVPIPSLRQND